MGIKLSTIRKMSQTFFSAVYDQRTKAPTTLLAIVRHESLEDKALVPASHLTVHPQP